MAQKKMGRSRINKAQVDGRGVKLRSKTSFWVDRNKKIEKLYALFSAKNLEPKYAYYHNQSFGDSTSEQDE